MARIMTAPISVEESVTWGTPRARWVLAATVLGSGIAFLDATVVNVALPTIGTELDASVAGLQWVIIGYTLTLASLILLGGSLGNRFGRRRIFLLGVVWFAGASLLCGVAPTSEALVAARALQGIGGALLTPGSLAILQASFAPSDRRRAVGAWSGLSGIAAAIAPFVGGWLIGVGSWRLIFLINVPLAVRWWSSRSGTFPRREILSRGRHRRRRRGADCGRAGGGDLGAHRGRRARRDGGRAVGRRCRPGLARRLRCRGADAGPMVPLEMFRSRQFTAANLVTLIVYASLSLMFFLLVVHLQQVLGYSPTQAGAATLPVTGLMLALSARAGMLAERIGPRLPMTIGPLGIAAGLALLSRVQADSTYVGTVPAGTAGASPR